MPLTTPCFCSADAATTVSEVKSAKKKQAFVLDKLPENVEVTVTTHELSEEERTCPVCVSVMESVGKEVVRTLEIVPAKFVVHEDRYVDYACQNCGGEETEEEIGETQFAKTPHEPTVYPGSYCSPAAAAYLMTQKFVMGSPLYRMEQDFGRNGLELFRQTMSNWMIYCAETWLTPIYERLHKMLLQSDIINADETELQVLLEPGRKPRQRATCGSTGQENMQSIRLSCMSTSRDEVIAIRLISSEDFMDICRRMDMVDTMR